MTARPRQPFPYLSCALAFVGVSAVATTLIAPMPDASALTERKVALAIAGSGLLLSAFLTLLTRYQRDAADPKLKPAHLAFMEPARPVVEAAGPGSRSSTKGIVAAAVIASHATPELKKLDDELRDINTRINRARVMLGMGTLSNEGYSAYVEELKQTRAELESRKIRLLHK